MSINENKIKKNFEEFCLSFISAKGDFEFQKMSINENNVLDFLKNFVPIRPVVTNLRYREEFLEHNEEKINYLTESLLKVIQEGVCYKIPRLKVFIDKYLLV